MDSGTFFRKQYKGRAVYSNRRDSSTGDAGAVAPQQVNKRDRSVNRLVGRLGGKKCGQVGNIGVAQLRRHHVHHAVAARAGTKVL